MTTRQTIPSWHQRFGESYSPISNAETEKNELSRDSGSDLHRGDRARYLVRAVAIVPGLHLWQISMSNVYLQTSIHRFEPIFIGSSWAGQSFPRYIHLLQKRKWRRLRVGGFGKVGVNTRFNHTVSQRFHKFQCWLRLIHNSMVQRLTCGGLLEEVDRKSVV